MEHRRILRDDTNRLADAPQLYIVYILVINEDMPALRIVESEEQADDGGFAAA